MLSEFFRYKGHLVIISITSVRAHTWRWGYCIDRSGYWYCEQPFDGLARQARDEAKRNARFDIDGLALAQWLLDASAGREARPAPSHYRAACAEAAGQWA
jgi:hypothetical protein